MKNKSYLPLLISTSLFALPQGPMTISGQADFTISSPEVLEIAVSDRSILGWSDFSIEAGETVRFLQPSSEASVLNRVLEANPSRLLGNLEANGQVLLINPNGILVGKEAVIDVGSMIASTLDIADAGFLSSKELLFEGNSQESIVNLGTIRNEAGDLFLIGANIENQGHIRGVKEGITALIGAQSVLIRPYEKERIFIREIFPSESAKQIKHYGTLSAEGSNSQGGEVLIFGDFIEIFDGSQIDASGDWGGGKIRIGGDLYGEKKTIPNARYVRLDSGAAIHSDALLSGDGGQIILWGEEACGSFGQITAKGSGKEGKGGMIEVSSKGLLAFEGSGDVTAPSGRGGTVLLDPTNVTIGGANSGFANTPCPAANFTFGANLTSNISIATLTGLLGMGGCTVTINTNQSTAASAGTMTISASFIWATDANLVLTSNGAFTINNNVAISSSGAGSLTINSGGAFTLNNNANINFAGAGNFTLTSAGPATIRGDIQNFSTGNVSITANGAVVIQGGFSNPFSAVSVGSQGGATVIDACNNPVTLQGSVTAASSFVQVGSKPIAGNATGSISVRCGDLNLIGGNLASTPARIGHDFSGPGGMSSGNITIACANLSMSGPSSSQIGHGVMTVSNPGTCTGDITVNAQNTIRVGAVAGSGICRIGHGVMAAINPGIGTGNPSLCTGNIQVCAGNDIQFGPNSPNIVGSASGVGHMDFANTVAGNADKTGNISIQTQNGSLFLRSASAAVGASAWIGHGTLGNAPAANAPVTLNGNIIVQVPSGSITLDTDLSLGSSSEHAWIGHGFSHLTPPASATILGNIDILCGQDLFMRSSMTLPINGEARAMIQHASRSLVTNITSNMTLRVGRDLTMIASRANTFIGSIGVVNNPPTSFTGALEVAVGRDLTIQGVNGQGGGVASDTFLGIGLIMARPFATTDTSTFLAVGRNLNVSIQNTSVRLDTMISDSNRLYIGVQGDITLTSNNTTNCANTFSIGALNNLSASSITQIFAGGSLIAANSPGCVVVQVGGGVGNPALFTRGNSLEIRAKGDIQLSSSFISPGVGGAEFILIEADANLLAGELWTNSGGQITSITNTALPVPLNNMQNFSCANPFVCAAGPAGAFNALPANLRVSSTGFAANGTGGFRANIGLNPNTLTLSTTAGPVTIHSGGRFVNAAAYGAASELYLDTISPPAAPPTPLGSVLIQTVNGNITIAGSVPTDGFANIFINSAATPWTTGNIYARASENLNVNQIVQTSGIGSTISLLADSDLNGIGNLNIGNSIATANGNILLQSGAGLGCSPLMSVSSVNQTSGAISSGAGNIDISADSDIHLTGAASLTASTGHIHTTAGHNTVLTNATLTKTGAGGDLLMISGNNMAMTNSHISAPMTARVTLVVDNCFPVSPLVGPGAFLMDEASDITGDPRIFTALRSLNSINGLLNGSPFVPGTLFVDTSTEVWCQYFAFPFPYPFPALGEPYAIFYKNCLGLVANQAQIIVTQFLLDLHPYNEFPGWQQEFYIHYRGNAGAKLDSSLALLGKEPFYITHRHLHPINQPKTYTTYVNDDYLQRERDGNLRVYEE